MKIRLLIFYLLIFSLIKCGKTTVDKTTTKVSSTPEILWDGIDSIDVVAGDSFKLNWTAYSGKIDNYNIYTFTNGTAALSTSVGDTITAYTFSGLNFSQSYTYRVRVVSDGVEDTNTNDLSASTLAVTADHGGWEHVKALGGRTPVSQSGLATSNPSVYLKWKTMTLSSSSINDFNIYRATTSGGQNFSSPLSTGINPTLMEYTDSSASAGDTYYYVVRPVVNSEIVPTTDTDTEIKIVTPPSNMSLIHRWIADGIVSLTPYDVYAFLYDQFEAWSMKL